MKTQNFRQLASLTATNIRCYVMIQNRNKKPTGRGVIDAQSHQEHREINRIENGWEVEEIEKIEGNNSNMNKNKREERERQDERKARLPIPSFKTR